MRRSESLNHDWIFFKEGAGEQISLPHTWNAVDGADGGDDYYRGCCYYERKFTAPAHEAGEQVYLEFAGVNAMAEVSLNGFPVGTHKGGYSAFRCNVMDVLKEQNTLEVVVDNSSNEEIYPQKADFTFYGGIYRDVKLVVVPETHFAMDYFGGPGVKVTPVMRDDRAEVMVELWLEWGRKSRDRKFAEVIISDQNGMVAKSQTIVEAPEKASETDSALPGTDREPDAVVFPWIRIKVSC